jgi:LysR family transcriptional regulator, carnitine catabolism transcriptional activator
MNVNMRQLRAIVAISRLGNFTRAAVALHVSQPALTVQIHQLEQTLGVRLLDRTTRSVRLTRIGEQVVPVIERALDDIDRAIASTHLTPGSFGIVSVAALPSLCANVLPPAIAAFNARHPGVRVRLHETSAARIGSVVLDNTVDFGIGIAERPLPELEATVFMTDRLVVVYPAEHPLARKRQVALADLAAYPIIALDSYSSVRAMLETALHASGHQRPAAHEVSFISTAVGMVRAGLGITVMSSLALGRAVLNGLQTRVIDHTQFNRDIVIVRRRGSTPSPAAEVLLDCIRDVRDTLPAQRGLRRRVPARKPVRGSMAAGSAPLAGSALSGSLTGSDTA